MKIVSDYLHRRRGGGTRVTLSVEAEMSGFFKLAEPVMAGMFKRQFDGMLANLKDILEAQG